MKFIVHISIIILLLTSCKFSHKEVEGNGKITTETREAKQASKIKVLGGMDVFVTQGPTGIKVEADEVAQKYIVTEENNGWLEIRIKEDVNLKTADNIKIHISTPFINAVQLAGSGDLTATGKFASDSKITFDVTGSGNARIDVNTPAVEAQIKGSGNVVVTGETRDVEVEIAGSGKFDGGNLKAENATVRIAGSGDAFVFAESKLTASIAGSGNVKYKGNAEVDKEVAGSGNIEKVQ